MFNGLVDWPWWGYVVFTLVTTHITIATITIFLHRHQAHRSLDLHPAVSHFFRIWLWLGTGMVTKAWTAIHRKHHARCETEQDPHSPQILGIRKLLLEGAELYRMEAKNQETLDKYGQGTPDDWLERNIYSRHSRYGIGLLLAIDFVLFGPIGLTIWAVQMLWTPWWAAGVINGIGHYWGYRNYETEDASTNVVPWGILIGGEELHNNHHAFPSSAKLSSRPWEFDIGWAYIRILAFLKLATIKKVAPKPVSVPGKSEVDNETARAILLNRFHILAKYCRDVIGPVLREEWEKNIGGDGRGKRFLRHSRRLLVRDEALLSDRARTRLGDILNSSYKLKTVYEYKLELKQLWQRSAAGKDTVPAIQEWCRCAEATGIHYLGEFAATLRTYSVKPAKG
jgi:stearoyl-CoA desaturase (delta-9 desaturase)